MSGIVRYFLSPGILKKYRDCEIGRLMIHGLQESPAKPGDCHFTFEGTRSVVIFGVTGPEDDDDGYATFCLAHEVETLRSDRGFEDSMHLANMQYFAGVSGYAIGLGIDSPIEPLASRLPKKLLRDSGYKSKHRPGRGGRNGGR